MSQAGIINVIDNNPTIPIYFEADTGFAVALFNVIRIVGAGGIATSATGNVITVDGSGITFHLTGDTGGSLSPTANNFNIIGGSGAAGTTPVQVNGAVSTLTVNVQKTQAFASSAANRAGIGSFDSTSFTVDANGYVTLNSSALGVLTVSGTANRITSTGGQNPVIDISAAYVGQTSITTLGTVTTGTWNGTAIGPTFGGTGLTTYTTGDTLYASAANVLSKLAIGSAGQVLTVTAGIPSWQTPSGGTVTSVSGTANRITSTGGTTPVIDIAATYVGQTSITTLGTITTGTWNGTVIGATFGGTGQSTYATGDTLYASAANTLSKLAAGSNGQVLTLAAGVPSWATPTTGTVTSVSGTANRITSTGGATPVIDISAAYVGQSSITTLGTITTGIWNGTTIGPTFGGTGLTTYATGDTLYASAANTLSKLAAGSNGQVLTLAAGIPSWATPTTGTVTSVSGTTNRITSTGGATPVIDISASYVGQSSITTLGTITTGVWQGTKVAEGFGGTNQSTYTTGDMLYASAANTLSKLAIGSTAQILTVAGGIPSWATSIYFSQVVVQIFTASGTYTPTAGMKFCTVELVAGGGGSGGIAATTGGTNCAASGGGGGAQYTRKTVTAATVGASQSITIGAGGTAGTNAPGNGAAGGITVFGALFQATGGSGGALMNATTTGNSVLGGAGSAAGGAGDFNSGGNPGDAGLAIFTAGPTVISGKGGSSIFGGGGISRIGNGVGQAGFAYGGGASGSAGTGTTALAGAAGAAGVCIITEYI